MFKNKEQLNEIIGDINRSIEKMDNVLRRANCWDEGKQPLGNLITSIANLFMLIETEEENA